VLDSGRNITYGYFKALLREEMANIRTAVGDKSFDEGQYRQAARLLDEITSSGEFVPFLTSVAYEELE
jgi:malate synthase